MNEPATPSPHAATLLARIEARTARIGIIGQGYVGLPLALVFAEAGFPVVERGLGEGGAFRSRSYKSRRPDTRRAHFASPTSTTSREATDSPKPRSISARYRSTVPNQKAR